YMRLAFAVASHLEPEILLVDEVLAVGDAAFQKKCLGKMGEVSRQGRTVVFVSHGMDAVRRLCRRTVWLDGGKVRQLGETREVVGAYLLEGVEAGSRATFDPPRPLGDPLALHEVSLADAGGNPCRRFERTQPIRVSIEWES